MFLVSGRTYVCARYVAVAFCLSDFKHTVKQQFAYATQALVCPYSTTTGHKNQALLERMCLAEREFGYFPALRGMVVTKTPDNLKKFPSFSQIPAKNKSKLRDFCVYYRWKQKSRPVGSAEGKELWIRICVR